MKNTLNGIDNRLNHIREKNLSELQDIKMIQVNTGERNLKDKLRVGCRAIPRPNICVTGVS